MTALERRITHTGAIMTPLMQQPGYVYRDRKRVLARRVQVGDILQPGPRSTDPISKRITVADVEVHTYLTYVTVETGQRFCLGSNTDKVYVDRIPKELS